MILGHDSPITDDGTGVTVSGATALLNLAGLVDGKPGTQELFEWGAGDTVTILVSWDRLIVPGVAALLNITGIPVGTKVTCGLRRPADASADYQVIESEIVEFPNGDKHALFYWPTGLDPIEAAEFSIIDDDSPAEMSENDQFTIGEVYVAPALYGSVKADTSDLIRSRTATQFSSTGQALITPAKAVREFRANLIPAQFSLIYGDIQDTFAKIAENPRVLLFASETMSVRRLTLYGVAELGAKIRRSDAGLWESSLIVREVR